MLALTRTRQHTKEYRLPSLATLIFVCVLLALILLRTYERSALAGALPEKSKNGQDYANLLSNDKADEFSKNKVSSDAIAKSTESKNSAATAASTFTVSPSTSPASTQPSGTTTATATSGGSTTATPPAAPFGAKILDVVLENTSIECSGTFFSQNCYKIYNFKGNLRAVNGQGIIEYSWVVSTGGSSSGSLTAPAGESFPAVTKQIGLRCDQPQNFTITLMLTAPNADQKQISEIHHACP